MNATARAFIAIDRVPAQRLATLRQIQGGARPPRDSAMAVLLRKRGLIAYDWDRPELTAAGEKALQAGEANE